MEILRNLRRLESRLTKTVEEATQKVAPASSREPLEVLHAIVDATEKRIEPAGRGKYVFPFDRINVCIAAQSSETRARFEAVLGSNPPLQDRIVERLQAAGCQLTGLSINTRYVDCSEPHWTNSEFHVAFDRFAGASQPRSQSNTAHPSLKLTIVHGAPEEPIYVFTTSRINLGRCSEVRD